MQIIYNWQKLKKLKMKQIKNSLCCLKVSHPHALLSQNGGTSVETEELTEFGLKPALAP